MRRERAKVVNVSALLTDMDRLIDFYNRQNKGCHRIVLTPEQYRAFLKKNQGKPYYREVLVVSQ